MGVFPRNVRPGAVFLSSGGIGETLDDANIDANMSRKASTWEMEQ
jgi:hypothetical protein